MDKKKDGVGGDINLGTDNWNVADGYAKLKILRQLILLDRYDTIAQFGTEDIADDMPFDDNTIKRRRIEALQRLHSTLKQLLGNVAFCLNKKDQEDVALLNDRIKTVGEFISKTFDSKEDAVTHEDLFEIEEPLFKKLIDILEDVKDKVNTYLNNANLIFRASEEIDIDKIMNTIVEGG